MLNEQEARQQLADFLNRKQVELSFREGRHVSQSKMADMIGIAQGSLSQYMNGTRLPDTDNKNALAAFFGTVIYDILGGPMMMPDDVHLREIAKVWGDLPKDTRKKLANMVADEAEVWRERATPKLTGAIKQS